MITRAFAIGRDNMIHGKETFLKAKNLIISIYSTGKSESCTPIFTRTEEDEADGRIIQLQFDDINPTPCIKMLGTRFGDMKFMDGEDAKKIVRFIDRYKYSSGKEILVVNCDAGICRSGAVASFAQLISDGEIDDAQFLKDNPHILPNKWVLDMLCATYLGGFGNVDH